MSSLLKRLAASLMEPPMCDNCGVRPKFSRFDYCGKACAAEAAAKMKKMADARRGSGGQAGATTDQADNSSSAPGSYVSARRGSGRGRGGATANQADTSAPALGNYASAGHGSIRGRGGATANQADTSASALGSSASVGRGSRRGRGGAAANQADIFASAPGSYVSAGRGSRRGRDGATADQADISASALGSYASAGHGSGRGRGGAAANQGDSSSSAPGSYASAATSELDCSPVWKSDNQQPVCLTTRPNYGSDTMLCEQCGIRPKNQDWELPFCGRNCAEIAHQKSATQQQQYAQAAAAAAPPMTRAATLDSARASRVGSRGVEMDSDEDTPSSKKPHRNAYDDDHNDRWGVVQSPLPKSPPVNPGISRAYSCCGCTIIAPLGSLPLECPICKLAEVKKELEAEKAKPPVVIRKEDDGSARRQLDEDDDEDDDGMDFFVRQSDPPPEGTPVHYCG